MNLVSNAIRYSTYLLAIAGVVAMGFVLQTIRSQESAIPPPPVAPPQKDAPDNIAATGILEAKDENIEIGVPAPGLVEAVKVAVNQVVKEGDPLLILDDRELRAALLKLNAAVVVAEANKAVAQAEQVKMQDMLDRLKSIPDQRAISQDDLRNRTNDERVAKAQLQAAEAQLAAAQADVKQTQLLIDRLTVKAPKSGTILQVNIRAGEYASPQNKQPALVLGDISTLHVRADVDEQNAMGVAPGLDASFSLKSDSSKKFKVQFVRIEPYVIPKVSLTGASTERVDTRVLQVIYKLDKPQDQNLYVGQQVDVFIPRKKQL
ncbi:efflux RND transporter periplasmic adaptor subunit [Prosthecobacter sp.]|uniref:efflux RND transporter periplasmic adaptor subunit n=1 Tax=Prosthecobacter sp. TaxID=1965333 RepID=UPI001DDABD92|nr:efflux RND transporter periplasmic adaptor subunit [Prosthecobacter sp.]MCB1278516.1 efflux RND transporter periplasmic adaptor subunit [Prosthecobacter sp.]